MQPFILVVIALGIVLIACFLFEKNKSSRSSTPVYLMNNKAMQVNNNMYEEKCKSCRQLSQCSCMKCAYIDLCDMCPSSDCMEAFEEDHFNHQKE